MSDQDARIDGLEWEKNALEITVDALTAELEKVVSERCKFEQAIAAANSWLACCENEPPDFERLRRMLWRPYEPEQEPAEMFGSDDWHEVEETTP